MVLNAYPPRQFRLTVSGEPFAGFKCLFDGFGIRLTVCGCKTVLFDGVPTLSTKHSGSFDGFPTLSTKHSGLFDGFPGSFDGLPGTV